MKHEVKSFNFEIKAASDNTFEGYASVFHAIDSYRDVIEPGAFAKTLQESKRVKVLWQHDPWTPIGKPVHMEEDSKGLYVKAKISETEEGKRAMILMKDGVIDELSIGFNTIKDEWDNQNSVRRIKEVRLWEFSPVTFAANEWANITGVKSIFDITAALKKGDLKPDAIKQAIEALTALLEPDSNEPKPPGGTQDDAKEAQEAAEEIKSMILQMRTWGGK